MSRSSTYKAAIVKMSASDAPITGLNGGSTEASTIKAYRVSPMKYPK
jgi:hypothetical protein